jgi:hypothetical protein
VVREVGAPKVSHRLTKMGVPLFQYCDDLTDTYRNGTKELDLGGRETEHEYVLREVFHSFGSSHYAQE